MARKLITSLKLTTLLFSASLFAYPNNTTVLDRIGKNNLTLCSVDGVSPSKIGKMLLVVDNSLFVTVEDIGKKHILLEEEVNVIVELVKEANELIKKDLNEDRDDIEDFLKSTQSKLKLMESEFENARQLLDQSQIDIGNVYCKISKTIDKLNELKKDPKRNQARINSTIGQLKTKVDYIFNVLETLNSFYKSFNILIENTIVTKNDIEDLRRDLEVYFNENCKEDEDRVCKYNNTTPISSYIAISSSYINFSNRFIEVSTIAKGDLK